MFGGNRTQQKRDSLTAEDVLDGLPERLQETRAIASGESRRIASDVAGFAKLGLQVTHSPCHADMQTLLEITPPDERYSLARASP